MQLPSYFSLLLIAAALSAITSSSFASFVEPEVEPSTFHKRSAEPEPEASSSEDLKYGSDNNGLFDYNRNALRRVSADSADLETEAHLSKFNNEFSFGHILSKRSAEPEPEAEAEPIGKSLSNNFYFPGRGWQHAIGSGFFNFNQRRAAETES